MEDRSSDSDSFPASFLCAPVADSCQRVEKTTPILSSDYPPIKINELIFKRQKKNHSIYLLIWLCWVSAAAHGIFVVSSGISSCGTWALVAPWHVETGI